MQRRGANIVYRDRNNSTHNIIKSQARLPLNKGHPDLSDSFWNNLTLFATGVIAHSVDMRELHRHNIKSRVHENRNWSLPQQVRLPSIDVALSGIFPSMANAVTSGNMRISDVSQPSVSNNSGGHGTTTRQQSVPQARDVSSKQAWANDIISIRFKGVQSPSKNLSPAAESGSDGTLECVSEAIIKVRRPGKFASLKGGMVDRDVVFNPQRGEFCLRIRHEVGKPTLAALKTKVKAVDRFVNSLESMDRAKGTIQSDLVTLGEVVFSYGETSTSDATENAAAQLSAKRWRVSLDLSKDEIDIKLAKDNPHLKVVDLMQNLVNREGGIEALMVWLPKSLPAMMAVDSIITAWDETLAKGQGKVEFSMRTIDWMSVRFTLAGADGNLQHSSRRLTLDLRAQIRRGELWWLVSRCTTASGSPAPNDEFTTALKSVWSSKGDGWVGLITSAAARPDGGVVSMLTAINDAIKALVGTAIFGSNGDASSSTVVTTQNSNSQSMQSFTQPTTQQSQGSSKAGAHQQQVVILD